MKPTLIIANDVAKTREELHKALQADFEILDSVASGKEALASIGRHLPSLAVLDMVMPDLSAIEVTRTLKEQGIPTQVVVVSGVRNEQIVLEAFQAGVADYIFSPIADDELAKELLEISRADLQA